MIKLNKAALRLPSRHDDNDIELIRAAVGDWAWGGWAWRGDLPPKEGLFLEGYERVDENTARIIAGLAEWRHYLERLERLYEEAHIPDDPVGGRQPIAAMIARLVTLVIEETGCDDAWYGYAIDAVSWFLQHIGIPPIEAATIAATSFEGRFESWIEPDAATRESAVGDAASAAFDAWRRVRSQEGR